MSEQPRPVPNDQPRIVDLVKSDLDARAEKGLETYGTYLQAFNGRDPAQDAYEEALDQAKFLKQLCIERKAMEARIAELESTVKSAKAALAYAYQMAGGFDAPSQVLDNLVAIPQGYVPPHDWDTLPPCKNFVELEARIAELERERDDARAKLEAHRKYNQDSQNAMGRELRIAICDRDIAQRERDEWRSKALDSDSDSIDRINELAAERDEARAALGPVTPCPNCDGKGEDARGSACCRIAGHAKECDCLICQWMRSSYANENAANVARAQAARYREVLAPFANHENWESDGAGFWIFGNDEGIPISDSPHEKVEAALAETPEQSLEAIRAEIEERMEVVLEAVHAQQFHEIAADPSRLDSMDMHPNGAPAALRKLRAEAAAQALEEAALVADAGMANFLRDKAAFIRNGAKA